MNLVLIAALLLLLLLFIGIFSLLVVLFRQRVRLEERISEQSAGPGFDWSAVSKQFEELAKPLGRLIPRSEKDLSREEKLLLQAGYRSRDAIYVLYGFRVILTLAILIAFIVSGVFWQNPLLFVLLTILASAALPDIWVRWMIGRRKVRIQHGLPDFMDLSVVCVEAGLGLDQTIQKVGYELRVPHPDLSGELRLYGLETAAGRSRAEALRGLAERTGVDDMRSFAAVLIQADRFGTSVAQTLRVFADDLRIKRRQRAEEIAAKITVKLVVPLMLFVMPAVLIVVAGPGVIAVARDLFGNLAQGN